MGKLLNLNIFVFVLTLLTVLLSLTLGTARVSWADSLGDEIKEFHHFLREHPKVAGQLQRDPWLANSSRYLNDHDDLRHFLRNHPRVRRELAANPGRVLNNSYAWDRRRYEDNRRYDSRRYDNDRPFDWWGWGRR